MDDQTIGSRVRQAITEQAAGAPHYEIAHAVGMKPDALSRAINGQRSFSSLELAALSDRLGVDIHWLITGQQDPRLLHFAARHSYDFATGERKVPGREADRRVLRDIELAYRQAGDVGASEQIPSTPGEMRNALGDDFVRPFMARLEERLGIHVVRVPELSTAYCFTVGARHVIAVRATGNWFYENFCLAHELAHLAEGHPTSGLVSSAGEAAANAFAAELLMPAEELKAADFPHMTAEGLARWVWDRGVSSDASARRIAACGIPASGMVRKWAGQPTQRLLRWHWRAPEPGLDEISERMAEAAQRHFPQALISAHVARIETGEIGPETLAWMLDVGASELDLEVPEPPNGDIDALADELGLTPAL